MSKCVELSIVVVNIDVGNLFIGCDWWILISFGILFVVCYDCCGFINFDLVDLFDYCRMSKSFVSDNV